MVDASRDGGMDIFLRSRRLDAREVEFVLCRWHRQRQTLRNGHKLDLSSLLASPLLSLSSPPSTSGFSSPRVRLDYRRRRHRRQKPLQDLLGRVNCIVFYQLISSVSFNQPISSVFPLVRQLRQSSSRGHQRKCICFLSSYMTMPNWQKVLDRRK
jgi:hypothetical protein